MKVLLALLCGLFVSLPFFLVKFPPITDLPQHVCQIRLFSEALSDPGTPYRIQWLTPYSLVYAILGFCRAIFGLENAGRLGMLMIVLFGVGMLHLLADRLKRPPLNAALAGVFFFSHILYWGFYQFVLGWPVFIGFLLLLRIDFPKLWEEVLAFLGIWVALYFSHIFWFLVALGWLGVESLFFRRNIKARWPKAVGALPLLALAVVWYPTLGAYGFSSQTVWATIPFERMLPTWIIDAAFGGIRGPLEPVIFGLVVVWAYFALRKNRKELSQRVDRSLLVLSISFLILAFVLPDKHTNTIRFCQRWVPPALVFFLLGLPAPRLRKGFLSAIVLTVLLIFTSLTSLNWLAFERNELSGLAESVSALPERSRVLGLSFIKTSAVIRGRPFIQVFSYSQVYRGGELNFSFADFGPSLVVYRQRRQVPWTPGLEWFPERAKDGDLGFFDFCLVSAADDAHSRISSNPLLEAVTQVGKWRLYRINEARPKIAYSSPAQASESR